MKLSDSIPSSLPFVLIDIDWSGKDKGLRTAIVTRGVSIEHSLALAVDLRFDHDFETAHHGSHCKSSPF